VPTAALASHFWPGDGVETEQPVSITGGQYPYWFDGSTVGVGYVPIRFSRKRIKGALISLYRRFLPERLFILLKVAWLLLTPDFEQARRVVRDVAKDPTSRSMKFWPEIQVALTRDPHVSENTWRATKATFDLAACSTLPRPDQRTLLELALLAYKVRKQ
jgi:hypothetical protein